LRGSYPTPHTHFRAYILCFENLVVLAVSLALGIKDTRPVLRLEVRLGIDIDLDLNVGTGLLNRVDRNTGGLKKATEKLSDARWAPGADNLSSLEGELGAKDRVLDGSITHTPEGEGLVDRGALVTKGEDGSRGINGNADGKATGNTGSGLARLGKLVDGHTGHVLELGGKDLGHVESGAALGLEGDGASERSSAGNKGGENSELHFDGVWMDLFDNLRQSVLGKYII